MARRKLMTYTVPEVCQMMGMPEKSDTYRRIRDGRFPFPVIEYAEGKFLVPRKTVDEFLQKGNLPTGVQNKGRPPRWVKGQYVNYNFRVPNDIDEQFKAICDYLNSQATMPIGYDDYKRLALREFIARRPLPKDAGGDV